MRILVVEDDPDIRGALEHNLCDAGHDVEVAGTGREALRAADASPPDLVLLDLMLPDLPGGEVCRSLRAAPRTRAIPVIIVTARRGEDDRISGLEQGADDYIEKPFSMRELLLRVEAVLRRSRRGGGAATDGSGAAGSSEAPVAEIDARRATAREQILVWDGFSANHFQRGEWEDCREISRAILRRYGDQLAAHEAASLRDRIRACEDRLTADRPPGWLAGDILRRQRGS